MRVSKGLTQDAVANELGCNQSKISKLEKGMDSDLTIREIEAYAKATNKDVAFLFSERNQSLAQQIKHHAVMIRSAFEKLVELAHKDDGIADGVAGLHYEVFMNVNRFLQETSEKLPLCESGKPYIRIAEGSSDPNAEPESRTDPAKPKKRLSRACN
jgi:transcriptional regulator with XRE-family HTH domain